VHVKLRAAIASIIFAACGLGGLAIASAVPENATQSITTTLQRTRIEHEVRLVTIHVRGKVIRRHDHVIVVEVPRVVFRSRVTHKRIVVPAHRVKIREPRPIFGVTSAIVGVTPLPVTVTVPVVIPGPVTTVPGPTTTITLPQDTTTVTVPTTITVPLTSSG